MDRSNVKYSLFPKWKFENKTKERKKKKNKRKFVREKKKVNKKEIKIEQRKSKEVFKIAKTLFFSFCGCILSRKKNKIVKSKAQEQR